MRSSLIAAAIAAAIGFAITYASPVQATIGQSAAKLAPPAPGLPVEPAACRGPGPNCPPGYHWVCGPYGRHCWCAPC